MTIDANTARAGNQAFRFIGFESFQKRAGELHVSKTAAGLLVESDTNGDAKAGIQVMLAGARVLPRAASCFAGHRPSVRLAAPAVH